MSAITIAALLATVKGITSIGSDVIDLINKIPSRRKVREEEIEILRSQIDELLKKQQDELKNGLSALANTLGAYIRAYFDLEPITDACELLQVYVEDNEENFAKKSVARHVWENVGTRLGAIQKKARDKYEMANVNQSGLLDSEHLTEIKIYVRDFRTASTQAKVYRKNESLDELRNCVEEMVEKAQKISNVLQHQINGILNQLKDLQ